MRVLSYVVVATMLAIFAIDACVAGCLWKATGAAIAFLAMAYLTANDVLTARSYEELGFLLDRLSCRTSRLGLDATVRPNRKRPDPYEGLT